MQGVYVNNAGTLPFEAANTSRYGNTYSGMQAYIAAMKQVRAVLHLQRGGPPGLAVGRPHRRRHQGRRQQPHPGQRDQRHQQAHQLHRRRHLRSGRLDGGPHRLRRGRVAAAYVQVQKTKYVPVFGKGKQVFVCVGKSVSNPSAGYPAARHAGGLIRLNNRCRQARAASAARRRCRVSPNTGTGSRYLRSDPIGARGPLTAHDRQILGHPRPRVRTRPKSPRWEFVISLCELSS